MGWFSKEVPKSYGEIFNDFVTKGEFSTTKEVFDPIKAIKVTSGVVGSGIVAAAGAISAIEKGTRAGVELQNDEIRKRLQ